MIWVSGSRAVGTFDGQDGIYLFPHMPINGSIIGKCTPSQLRVNWMTLMITIINWVSRIKRY